MPKPPEPEETPYQTDKEIKDDTDKLFKECIDWAFVEFNQTPYPFNHEDLRTLAITRFLYLKDKVLNHSPKFYRDKELHCKYGKSTPVIQKEEE